MIKGPSIRCSIIVNSARMHSHLINVSSDTRFSSPSFLCWVISMTSPSPSTYRLLLRSYICLINCDSSTGVTGLITTDGYVLQRHSSQYSNNCSSYSIVRMESSRRKIILKRVTKKDTTNVQLLSVKEDP